MSDKDVFDGPTEAEVPAVKFDDLVGEGKKYSTTDDAAKALVEKDHFIEQLKRENAEAREALSKRNNEEEFLTRLEQVARKSPVERDTLANRDEPVAPAVTPEAIEAIIEKREAVKLRQNNLDAVQRRLQDTFGDSFKSRVQSQARELGVGTSFLTNIAAENPEAFYKLMGLNQTQTEQFTPPPRPSVNTTARSTTTGRRDYSYFQQERQKKGDGWYFSIPVQQEIWKAAKEAESRGEKFLPD